MVKAADAYGEYDKAEVREIPRDQLPPGTELKAGRTLPDQRPTPTTRYRHHHCGR